MQKNYFKISIGSIKDSIENNIQNNIKKNNNPNISDYEKRIDFLKSEETTTINEIPKKIDEIYEKDNNKNNEIKIYNNNSNLINEKDLEDENQKCNEEKSYSTDYSSFINSSQINNSNLDNTIKKSKQPNDFNIDIDRLNNESEMNIQEKIKDIKDPNLSEYEKRKKVLQELKTITVDIRDNMNEYHIDINKIKEKEQENIKENINKDPNSSLNEYQKIEKYCKDSKTTTNNIDKKTSNESYNDLSYSSINYNNNSSISQEDTRNTTYLEQSQIENEDKKEEKKEEKRFNITRANFYIKYSLYDLIPNQEESNIIIPEKYKIDDKLSSFLYPDDYNTFYFTKCRKLGEEKIINDLDNEETKFTKFNNSLGLYFCGKEIKIENEIKKCAPNEFICKECMGVNKKKYNIKNDCLININGRVAKINEGSYHCFGHFLCGSKGNQIEDCISKYSCKACKMLDLYSKYYL
jgi:hypothetical protein